MPHLLGGMDYLGKGEALTDTDLDRLVNNIWEEWIICVYRKSFRSLSSARETLEQKQKGCIYISVQFILFCYIIFHYTILYFITLYYISLHYIILH